MSGLFFCRRSCRPAQDLLHPSLRWPSLALPFQRNYSQATELPRLPQWPVGEHPTPYDIFNTTKDALDKKAVRTHFYTLAKIYHPDSIIVVNAGLTPELKAERFKKIVAAYDILRDEEKRKDYDVSSKGWDYADASLKKKSNFYGRDFGKAAQYSTKTNTGTAWDDYHQDYKDYQKQQDPEYQKEAWERHKKMVVVITIGSLLVGAFQLKFLLHSAGKDIEGRNRLSSEARKTVYLANNNYGMGVDKSDRIQRFLAHREGTSSYDNYRALRESQEAEKLALSPPREESKS